MHWVGYKVHLTESCDDDSPRIITQVLTTAATTTDDSVTESIHDELAAKGLTPSEHLVDSGYTEADVLVSSRNEHQIDLI
jgi:transposase